MSGSMCSGRYLGNGSWRAVSSTEEITNFKRPLSPLFAEAPEQNARGGELLPSKCMHHAAPKACNRLQSHDGIALNWQVVARG